MRNVIASIFSVLMVYGVASSALADESSPSNTYTYTWSNSYVRQLHADSIRSNAAALANAQVNNGAYYQQNNGYANNAGAPIVTGYGYTYAAPGFYFPYGYQRF